MMPCSEKCLFARSSTGPYVLFEASINLHQTEVVRLPLTGPLLRAGFPLGG